MDDHRLHTGRAAGSQPAASRCAGMLQIGTIGALLRTPGLFLRPAERHQQRACAEVRERRFGVRRVRLSGLILIAGRFREFVAVRTIESALRQTAESAWTVNVTSEETKG